MVVARDEKERELLAELESPLGPPKGRTESLS